MQEILGTELEVGQEYYVMKQEKNPLNSVDGQWETRVKYSGTYTLVEYFTSILILL
jgi:hypothetical protein